MPEIVPVEVPLHLETISTIPRHGLVSDHALRPRRAPAVPIHAIWRPGQPIHGFAEADPAVFPVSGFRPGHRSSSYPDRDRPPPTLGNAVVRCVQDILRDSESKDLRVLLE